MEFLVEKIYLIIVVVIIIIMILTIKNGAYVINLDEYRDIGTH